MVTTSRTASSTGCSPTASANRVSGVTGRNSRSTRWSATKRARANGSRRTASSQITSVPPKHSVEKISCTEKSKLTAQNWSVRSAQEPGRVRSCQFSRLARARWVMAAPLGAPVEPEVNST
ncbi:hypothetical protein K5M73_22965 [Streptomonospora halotolerans]|nr:hypothetical protein [Streptomonospora nanhaiensis]MBX9391078.1 hypothetical protein [Streptomonospora nanhaiensis]